ncbi:MAG: class I SAM-dependent methyltransferase [Rubrobacteraceae bacterium]
MAIVTGEGTPMAKRQPVKERAGDPRKQLVEAGYDRMAGRYLTSKDPEDPQTLAALEDLAERLPHGVSVLDLGCGAGVPATKRLAAKYSVTGVDISEKQLELARRNVPGACFLKADMTNLDFEPETFAAIVAFVSIIHVPREEHRALFGGIHRWLKPADAPRSRYGGPLGGGEIRQRNRRRSRNLALGSGEETERLSSSKLAFLSGGAGILPA